MRKKKNIKRSAEEEILAHEALNVLKRSEQVWIAANAIEDKIEAFNNKYTDEVMDSLPWDKKEKAIQEMESLEKELSRCDKLLEDVEKEYDKVRLKVNEFYGHEVMQSYDPLPNAELEKEVDESDWWKKE